VNANYPRRSSFSQTAFLICLAILLSTLTAACINSSPTPNASNQEKHINLTYDSHSAEHLEASLDLDDGQITSNNDADLAFVVTGGTDLFNVLKPVNGAKKFELSLSDVLTIEDCENHLGEFRTTNTPEVVAGKQIRILTNRNQLALITIDKVSNPIAYATNLEITFLIEPQP
jgi:hypothetical protein